MRFLHIYAENFRSHARVDLDLSAVQSAAIVGRNGGGKSSLLGMIEWCLFGTGSQEATMRRGEQRMSVQLDVHAAGRDWQITRGRDHKRAWLKLDVMQDGEQVDSLTCRTIAETQAKIIEHVTGIDGDAFRATVYAPQGQAGMLSALTPARRKELLAGLLGLDRWEDYRSTAALQARDESSDVIAKTERRDRLAGQITELEQHLTAPEDLDAAVADAEKAVADATAAQEARQQVILRASLIAQMSDLKARADRAREATHRLAQLDDRLANADSVQDRFDRAQDRKADYDQRVAAARAEHDGRIREYQRAVRDEQHAADVVERAERAVQRAESVLEGKIAAVTALDEEQQPSCPTCGQDVADTALAKARAALEQAVATAEQAVAEAKSEHAAAADRYAQASAAVGDAPGDEPPPVDPGDHDQASFDKLRALVAEHAKLRGERDAIAEPEDLEDLSAQWTELRAQAVELPKEAPKAPDPHAAQQALAEAQRAVADARARQATERERRTTLDRLRAEHDEVAEALPAVQLRAQALGVLASAFGRNGIPALILDNATGALQAAANEALNELGGGMRLRLATQRTTRSGGVSETLDILVSDGVDEVPVEVFSGGERYRVHIALRLGLAAALHAADGHVAEALLLDEPTDLDRQGMIELGRLLTRMPQQTLVVSHDNELIDTLPTAIRVDRAREPRAASTVTVT